jgi:hypothetical protein
MRQHPLDLVEEVAEPTVVDADLEACEGGRGDTVGGARTCVLCPR